MPIAIIVHGGSGSISADRIESAKAGCQEAALLGWRILQAGGSALDAVEVTVRALEDNPNYNAGTGSCLTANATIEMDAGLMTGHTLQVGAVASVERIKNPISLARRVLASPHVLLTGRGAIQFAIDQGLSLCREEDLQTERQHQIWQQLHEQQLTMARQGEPTFHRREIGSIPARIEQEQNTSQQMENGKKPDDKHGTVGAVAIDYTGNLVAATSTGGFPYKLPGRVGDSPLVGCGFYADENAAISCTGDGEDFTRLLIAKRAADNVARGMSAREAAEATIALLGAKAEGTGGLIMVDRVGNVGFAWNSQNMVYAYLTQDMTEPFVGV
ncbi:MAG: isoaspartyl peptidase/L-asparaginase [Ktedonobacteraceae bacterium]